MPRRQITLTIKQSGPPINTLHVLLKTNRNPNANTIVTELISSIFCTSSDQRNPVNRRVMIRFNSPAGMRVRQKAIPTPGNFSGSINKYVNNNWNKADAGCGRRLKCTGPLTTITDEHSLSRHKQKKLGYSRVGSNLADQVGSESGRVTQTRPDP